MSSRGKKRRRRDLAAIVRDILHPIPHEPLSRPLAPEVEDLLWDYALGLLEPDDQRRVIRLLAASPRAAEALVRTRRSLVDAGVPHPIQSPENELCSEVERRLRQYLAPRIPDVPTFNLEDVVQLCRRQWERGELSPTRLDEATAGLPTDIETLLRHVAQQADAIAPRVCAEPYVQDCIQIARFLASESEQHRTEIRNGYWLAFKDWAYGEGEGDDGKQKRCGGVLGARLILYLGNREAENQFAAATSELDDKVFALAAFGECVRAYRPGLGMKFENFYKTRIDQRAGDVARHIARTLYPRDPKPPDVATILSPWSEVVDAELPDGWESAYRECLERFRHSQRNRPRADRKIAAFELHYKAYLDPDSQITRQTLELVAEHRQQLRDEFLQCQQDLRVLEDDLSAAESQCSRAGQAYEAARYELAREACSLREFLRWESEASRENMTQMRKDLAALRRADRNRRKGWVLQYKIGFKTWARARGSRETRRKQWEKWEQCRLPWVRSQAAIAELLESNQPAVGTHLAEVKRAMRDCMGFGPEPETA